MKLHGDAGYSRDINDALSTTPQRASITTAAIDLCTSSSISATAKRSWHAMLYVERVLGTVAMHRTTARVEHGRIMASEDLATTLYAHQIRAGLKSGAH
jgi:hypothetical protein